MASKAGTTPMLSPSTTVPSLELTTSGLPDPTSTKRVFALNSDPVYYMAVQVTNSVSTAGCLLVIFAYTILRQKHPRLMTRTSLVLSLAMACTDLLYHCANLAGFGELPDGFGCALVGGWLFAFGSMLSLFYAAAIALNTQLAFVHDRTPRDNKQIYFLVVPPIIAFLIATPALIAGVYGYDQKFDYCWYETRGLDDRTVILRMVFTYNLWLSVTLLYLVVAAILITWSIFDPSHPLAARPAQVEHSQRISSSNSMANVDASFAAILGRRRDIARRALTLRLLGYILVPTISIISGMILDLLGQSKSGAYIPKAVTTAVDALAGLMGTLNAILFGFDPSVLAVIHHLQLLRAQRRRQQHSKHGDEKQVVGATNTGAKNTNSELVITRVDPDTHLEAGSSYSDGMVDHGQGPHTGTETVDEDNRRSNSTIGYDGYDVDEILEMYHGW